MAYGSGVFVAVGRGGSSMTGYVGPFIDTSTDGISWVPQDTSDYAPSFTMTSVAYGPPGFVAVDGEGKLFHSLNGATWTDVTPASGAFGNSGANKSILWDGAEYLVFEYDLTTIAVSADGTTWRSVTPSAASSQTLLISSIAKFNGTYYGLYSRVLNSAQVLQNVAGLATSSDLVHWTQQSITALDGKGASYVTVADGKLIAVGGNGLIATSVDGAIWNDESLIPSLNLAEVAWNGQAYVAVGDIRSSTIVTSADGVKWIPIDVSGLVSGVPLTSVTAAPNGAIVAVGMLEGGTKGAAEIVSLDGIHWAPGKP